MKTLAIYLIIIAFSLGIALGGFLQDSIYSFNIFKTQLDEIAGDLNNLRNYPTSTSPAEANNINEAQAEQLVECLDNLENKSRGQDYWYAESKRLTEEAGKLGDALRACRGEKIN